MVSNKKKKKPASNQAQIDRIKAGSGGSRKDALELATSRARAEGLKDPALSLGGQIITGEDVKKEEARRIAEKNVAIDRAEAQVVKESGIQKPTLPETEEEEATEEAPKETKGEKGFAREFTITDATGFEKTMRSPITEEEFKSSQQAQLTADITTLGLAASVGRVPSLGGPVTNTIFKSIMTKKALVRFGAAVSGANIIATWYAADNVQSAIPFHLKEVRTGLARGDVPPEQAEELVAEAQSNFDKAGNFISTSTRLNPVLWPFRNLYMSGQEQKQAEIDTIINSMTNQNIQ